jgi:hypothetical protein
MVDKPVEMEVPVSMLEKAGSSPAGLAAYALV